MLYYNFINGFLETLIRRKNPFLCKNVKMRFLRYCLRELKRLSEVVIEELHLLWSETALCGDVPRGGETCREFGVGTNPVI